MRISSILMVVLMFAGGRVIAQQSSAEASHSQKAPAPTITDAHLLDSLAAQGPLENGAEANVSAHLQARGPLADLFHARNASDFSGRLVSFVNPLAKAEPKTEPGYVYSASLKRVSPRAWTTMVGWHPGGSAFADPITHEPSMTLLTIGRAQ